MAIYSKERAKQILSFCGSEEFTAFPNKTYEEGLAAGLAWALKETIVDPYAPEGDAAIIEGDLESEQENS